MLLGLSTTVEHKNPEEWADKMKDAGCGSVVFPVNYLAGEETIKAYQNAANEAGLVIAEVGIWNNMLDLDESKRQEAIKYAIGQLKMADAIGAVCCVNVAGTPVGPRWDGGYRDNFSQDTWEKTVKTVQYVIDQAKPVHTYFCIESMPWMIPTSPDEYLRLIHDVNRPQFMAHLDVVNMITDPRRYFYNEQFLRGCFIKLKGKICSCHLKDIKLLDDYTFQLRETRCGDGILDLELYAELAEAENLDMPMIIEHLETDEEYMESLAYVKKRLGK